jgi:hypothetical protein
MSRWRLPNSPVGLMARLMGVLALLAAMLSGQPVPVALADTATVCADGCAHTTIAAAVQAADSGGTIAILDAVHTESGIVVDKDLTIAGGHAAGTIVQAHASKGQAADRVFRIVSGAQVVIRDMTIWHGKVTGSPARGGGISNQGTLILEQVTVEANQAVGDPGGGAEGGGIYNEGVLEIADCTINDNTARGGDGASVGDDDGGDGYGGGLFGAAGSMTMVNSTVSANRALGGAGFG